MKYPEVKSVLEDKWFMSLRREGGVMWWGHILQEVHEGTYLVQDDHGTKGVVLVERMTGWRFFDTWEELSKAMDEIKARLERIQKREGGAV